MMGMDCVNQQARERDCKLTKRSQAERLAIADSLIASVWEEYLNGSIDRGTLQVAAYIQANANRIVWKLNELNNPNTPNTLKALDCISRKDAIDALERKKDKNAKGDIGGFYNKIIQNDIDTLMQMPSVQPDLVKYEYHYDHTDCIWYRPEARNRCPSTCAQYRDGWNDAMNYIFRDGKGYRPYRRDRRYEDVDTD